MLLLTLSLAKDGICSFDPSSFACLFLSFFRRRKSLLTITSPLQERHQSFLAVVWSSSLRKKSMRMEEMTETRKIMMMEEMMMYPRATMVVWTGDRKAVSPL